MRIFVLMKSRLNITVDDKLLNDAKQFASRRQTSLSQLIEHYFKRLTKPSRRENIIQQVEQLKKPRIKPGTDLKKSYYEDQKKKYGL